MTSSELPLVLVLFFASAACAATVVGRIFLRTLTHLLTEGFSVLSAGLKKPLHGVELWTMTTAILLAFFFFAAALQFGEVPAETVSQSGSLFGLGIFTVELLRIEIVWPWALAGALVWCVLPRRTGWKNLGGLLGCCLVGPLALLIFFSRESAGTLKTRTSC